MGRMVSPNEIVEAAKRMQLDGREPASYDDWMLVMNFCAANVDPGSAEPACLLLNMLFDMGLSEDDVRAVVAFQVGRRLASLN